MFSPLIDQAFFVLFNLLSRSISHAFLVHIFGKQFNTVFLLPHQLHEILKSDHFSLLACTILNFFFLRFSISSLSVSSFRMSVYASKWFLNSSLIRLVGVKEERIDEKTKIINFWTHDFFSINRRVDFWPFYASSQYEKVRRGIKGIEKSNNRQKLTFIFSVFKRRFMCFNFFGTNSNFTWLERFLTRFLLPNLLLFCEFAGYSNKNKHKNDHVTTQTRSQQICLQSHSKADSSGFCTFYFFLFDLNVCRLFAKHK